MIIGHERQIAYLEKSFKNGRLSHVYLFYGPENVGKLTVAKHFVGFFYKPEVFILDRKHSLVFGEEERKDISIEDIRALKRILSFVPEDERWRIIIINEAEKLSHPAADAFLKLLEEPGRKTLFILITSFRELLHHTIVSRSVPIRFSLVKDSILEDFLKESVKDKDKRKEILLFTAGRPGVMMRILEDKEYLEEERKTVKEIATILKGKDLPEALCLSAKTMDNEERRKKLVEYVLRIMRKKMLDNKESVDVYRYIEVVKNLSAIADIIEITNVNPRLALDVMFLEVIQN